MGVCIITHTWCPYSVLMFEYGHHVWLIILTPYIPLDKLYIIDEHIR